MKNLFKIFKLFIFLNYVLIFIFFGGSYQLLFEYIGSLEILRGYELISFLIFDFFLFLLLMLIYYSLDVCFINAETRDKLMIFFILFFICIELGVLLFVIILWFMAIVSPDTLLCTVGSVIKINRVWTRDQLKWVLFRLQIAKSFYIADVVVYDEILLKSKTGEDVRRYFEAYRVSIEESKYLIDDLTKDVFCAYVFGLIPSGLIFGFWLQYYFLNRYVFGMKYIWD